MKLINTLLTILLITLLSSPSWSTPLVDLVNRDGLYYLKFSGVPFTGKVTGTSQGSLKNGEREGDWVHYWDNGQLKSKGNYTNGKKEGVWVHYWDNGRLSSKGNMKNGKDDGDWIHYWDNGQLKSKGNYTNGKMEGIWVAFYTNGEPIDNLTDTFKNGVQISD